MNIDVLKQRLADTNAEAQQIKAVAEDEQRDLTTEEEAKLDQLLAGFARTKENIDRLEKLNTQTDALHTPNGRKTEPDQPKQLAAEEGSTFTSKTGVVELSNGERYSIAPKNWGFTTLGEYARNVRAACIRGGEVSKKLQIAQSLASASTYGSEGAGADGGFAIPPEFRNSIMQTIQAEDSLLSRCDVVTTAGNTFVCPMDETTPWQTSGGILANWEGEASAATQSKPALGERTVKLNKLRVLVPMTEELLEDAPGLSGYLQQKAPAKIAFKINDALINGTGVGMPLGILNSPALISVTKQSSQVANTIVGNNIIKMYNRMYGPCRSSAVWVYNQEVEPQLFKLSVPGTDDTGNAVSGWGGLVYMPPGGVSSAPYGSLYGRPAIPTQACQALSSLGDILFVDFSQYLVLLKGGANPKLEVSMHLWFDQDITAFKFTLRMGGVPWWSTTAAAKNGSNTYSPYVGLQAR